MRLWHDSFYPYNRQVKWLALALAAIAFACLGFFFLCAVGCASLRPVTVPTVSTKALTGSIDSAQTNAAALKSNLSDLDDKVVSIKGLLR